MMNNFYQLNHYINHLYKLKTITKEEKEYLISEINNYKNNPETIPTKYSKLIKRIFENNYLFTNEDFMLEDIIKLQNKLVFYNPILKNEYLKNGSIVSKIEDYHIHPSSQIDYLTKKIDEGILYNYDIHIKR